MTTRKRFTFLAFWFAAGLLARTPAHGDLVLLKNGRTLPVSEYRIEGDRIVLLMEGGGLISLRGDLVAEVLPDPMPAEPGAGPGPAVGTAAEAVAGSGPMAGEEGVAGAVGEGPGEEPIRLQPGQVFDRASLRDLAARLARKHKVSEALVQAVIEVESRYDAFAVSPRGAMGLMQLMPGTAQRFAVANAFDPVQNVEGGVRYLRELLVRYNGELRLALAAYNAGEEAVDRFGGIPPYRETRQYVVKILKILTL